MSEIKITDDEMNYVPGEKILFTKAEQARKQATAMLEKEKRDRKNKEEDEA